MSTDPRIEVVADALLRHHFPNKNPSAVDPGARERALSDATVMLASLDNLRRSADGDRKFSCSDREVEWISSAVRSRTLDDAVTFLRGQVEASAHSGHTHLNDGLRWAIAVLTGRKDLP